MGIGTQFSADRDLLNNSPGDYAAYTGTSTSAANTVPTHIRRASITSDRTFTLTLPTRAVATQTLAVSWTLSAAGYIVFMDGTRVAWISDSYTSSASGHMMFIYDGSRWYPMNGALAPTSLVAATGNIVANAMVKITGATFAYASASALGAFGVVPVAATAAAACHAIPWGSRKEHTLYSATAAAITAGDLVMINGAAGGVVTATGSGVVIVGYCLATIGATGGLPVRIAPVTPYLSA